MELGRRLCGYCGDSEGSHTQEVIGQLKGGDNAEMSYRRERIQKVGNKEELDHCGFIWNISLLSTVYRPRLDLLEVESDLL